MFYQIIEPVADSLGLSFLVAIVPIVAVLVLLGVLRRPAWQASGTGLILALVLATTVWKCPLPLALDSVASGIAFAIFPIMWIVVNALVLYNLAVMSGRFDAFRDWLIANLPNDRRVVLVVIGFSFGCLLEGVAGFGTPIAITSSLLIAMGFPAYEALVFTLIFNTAPVAFGGLGVPVTTLAAVTGLPDHLLGAMIGRQLPFLATLLPFYAIAIYGGWRAIRGVWPILLIAGGSFGLAQFIASNYLGYALTDVISSLTSLGMTLGFARIWRPASDPLYALAPGPMAEKKGKPVVSGWYGWMPWLVLSITVILWLHLGLPRLGQVQVSWPGLHNAIFITTYHKPYAAIWTVQPLGAGTAIMMASMLTCWLVGLKPKDFLRAFGLAGRQIRIPAFTTALTVGLAYLMNYSGMAYTLGVAIASVGMFFPIVSVFMGWLAVFLSGSDTSGNALFGNLQVVAANHLGLNPVLMAAANSSGGVMGKMVSPQNICTGTVETEYRGREGEILAGTFRHSIVLTILLGLLVAAEQFLIPFIIPGGP